MSVNLALIHKWQSLNSEERVETLLALAADRFPHLIQSYALDSGRMAEVISLDSIYTACLGRNVYSMLELMIEYIKVCDRLFEEPKLADTRFPLALIDPKPAWKNYACFALMTNILDYREMIWHSPNDLRGVRID